MISMMVVALGAMAVFASVWSLLEANSFREASRIARKRSAAAGAELIREETEKALRFIQNRRRRAEAELQEALKDRVYEAHAVASHLFERHDGILGAGEIGALIRESLRPIRHLKGRGYYFITRLDGLEVLFADRPEMEGLDLLDMTDTEGRKVIRDMIALVREEGEGVYRYTWSKPGFTGRGFPKVAFVKLFEPLGWLIGTGEYLDDFENDLQRDILDYLETVTFGRDGYLFAGTWEGLSLMGPARGQNMWETTDSAGVKVVQELIGAARAGGGYVRYVMPPLKEKAALPELSYAASVPDWQWYVGAGVYLADIEELIAGQQAALGEYLKSQRRRLAVLLAGLLGLTLLAAVAFVDRLSRELRTVSSYLDEAAAATRLPLAPEARLHLAELHSLGRAVARTLEQRLEAERNRALLAAAVEHSSEVVLLLDRHGTVLYANSFVERTTGLSREELVGKPIPALSDYLGAEEVFRAAAEGRPYQGRVARRRKDGRLIDYDVSIAPLNDESGEVTTLVLVLRDVTDRLQLEAQLAQSQKMEAVGRLAGGVAHDFNNLLQIIQSNTELALGDLPAGHAARAALTEVLAATGTAAGLVSQLLAYSRRETLHRRPVDLNQLVDRFLQLTGRLLGEHIGIVFRRCGDAAVVNADPGQVQQVLINVCANARDAMPAGGTITISVGRARADEGFCQLRPWAAAGQGYVRVSVHDTGAEIPPEVQKHMFEPFFSTKLRGKGTGLGLASVYGIVKQHGGGVELESHSGYGTELRIYLPAAEGSSELAEGPQPPVAAERPLAAAGSQHRESTILLAEDDPALRRVAVSVLSRAGYRVIAAKDGKEAEALFEEHSESVDLVVLDVVMPKKNGYDVARHIRTRRPALPVLLSSGYDNQEILDGGETAIRFELLSKPYRTAALLERVRQMLSPEHES